MSSIRTILKLAIFAQPFHLSSAVSSGTVQEEEAHDTKVLLPGILDEAQARLHDVKSGLVEAERQLAEQRRDRLDKITTETRLAMAKLMEQRRENSALSVANVNILQHLATISKQNQATYEETLATLSDVNELRQNLTSLKDTFKSWTSTIHSIALVAETSMASKEVAVLEDLEKADASKKQDEEHASRIREVLDQERKIRDSIAESLVLMQEKPSVPHTVTSKALVAAAQAQKPAPIVMVTKAATGPPAQAHNSKIGLSELAAAAMAYPAPASAKAAPQSPEPAMKKGDQSVPKPRQQAAESKQEATHAAPPAPKKAAPQSPEQVMQKGDQSAAKPRQQVVESKQEATHAASSSPAKAGPQSSGHPAAKGDQSAPKPRQQVAESKQEAPQHPAQVTQAAHSAPKAAPQSSEHPTKMGDLLASKPQRQVAESERGAQHVVLKAMAPTSKDHPSFRDRMRAAGDTIKAAFSPRKPAASEKKAPVHKDTSAAKHKDAVKPAKNTTEVAWEDENPMKVAKEAREDAADVLGKHSLGTETKREVETVVARNIQDIQGQVDALNALTASPTNETHNGEFDSQVEKSSHLRRLLIQDLRHCIGAGHTALSLEDQTETMENWRLKLLQERKDLERKRKGMLAEGREYYKALEVARTLRQELAANTLDLAEYAQGLSSRGFVY